MSYFASIAYGFISGITEILPVSSRGHQGLMRYLFGVEARIPLQDILVHIGVFIALIVGCSEMLNTLMREQRSLSARHRRKHRTDGKARYELRLLKSASIILFIALFGFFKTANLETSLLRIMAFWIVNAIVLFVADHMPRGNRDARTMSSLDGVVMGIAGALSVFPGISRTSFIASYTIARGVVDDTSASWALLLSIPAMIFYIFFDVVALLTSGTGIQSMGGTVCCILSGVAAFVGGYLGVSLLKLLLNHTGLSKFAYYSIGVAMFSFAIYLIT